MIAWEQRDSCGKKKKKPQQTYSQTQIRFISRHKLLSHIPALDSQFITRPGTDTCQPLLSIHDTLHDAAQVGDMS